MATAAVLSLPLSPRLDDPFHQQQRHVIRPTPLNLNYALHKSHAAIASNGGALISPVTPRSPYTSTSSVQYPRLASPIAFQRRRGSSSLDHRDARRWLGVTSDGQAPPLSARPVLPTPSTARRFSMPTPPEQDLFETLCRRRFYEASVEAAAEIDRILRDSAASHTAQTCYNRILSSIRAEYHDHVAKQKRKTLDTALRDASPNPFLTPAERKLALKQFLAEHVSREMIGTHPFAKGLYTLLRLQSLKSSKGGAGGSCLQWTIEDGVRVQPIARCIELTGSRLQVFMEAGPAQWTRDSVRLLKSVGEVRSSLLPMLTRAVHSQTLGLVDLAEADSSDQSPFSDDEPPNTTANETGETTADASTASDASMVDPFSDQRGGRRGSSRILRSAAGVLEDGHQRTFRIPPSYRDVELEE